MIGLPDIDMSHENSGKRMGTLYFDSRKTYQPREKRGDRHLKELQLQDDGLTAYKPQICKSYGTGTCGVLSGVTAARGGRGMGKVVVIEGNIGVGKTTLSQKLAKELNYKLCLEPTVENPYLEKFYAEPKEFALPLQLWILQQRYLTYIDAVKHVLKTGEGVILDRSVFSDVVFANVCTKEGYISPEGYSEYLKCRRRILKYMPHPHITLYLDATPHCCYARIQRRGRECEEGVPIEYLMNLHEEYMKFLQDMKVTGSTLLRYDWSNFDHGLKICSVISETTTSHWNNQVIEDFETWCAISTSDIFKSLVD